MAEKEQGPGIDPAIMAALSGLPDDFRNFASVFETRIRPVLREREHDRASAAAKAIKGRWYGLGVALVGAAIGLFLVKAPPMAIFAAVAGLGTTTFMGSDLRRIGKEAKQLMVTPVASEFGLNYMERPGHQPTIRDFREMGLVSNWDRENFEDRLTGQRGEVDFEFFEAHLEQKRTTRDSKGRTRTTWVTIFRGQCLRFDFHKEFLGRTLVSRDAGIFDRFGGRGGMKLAKLEDPVFEKAFSVYTTDQVESRFLLTPDFMQKLVDLEQAFRGGRLRCAFVGGQIFIAVEGGDLFEPGSLFTPLDNPKRIRELLDDFAAVFHIIDSVSDASARRK